MKVKTDISDYIQNFDNDVCDKNEWLDVHINMMFHELCEIQNTIYIFEIVNTEWEKRVQNGEKIGYSAIRTILFEALPYKIFMGLSKILVGDQEYSLLKSINVISQINEYKNKKEIKDIMNEIRTFLSSSDVVKVVTTCRDQFFAHLDKKCVLSDYRIAPTCAMKEIDNQEIVKITTLVRKLYECCFGVKLEIPDKKILPQDVIHTFFWMPC